jgi:uncharacterized protein YjaG (DUF416 family)
MTTPNISLAEKLEAKSVATEIVLMALLREKSGDVAFWNSLEKLTQVVLSLDEFQDIEVRPRADAVQGFLDSWRQIAGDDPAQPSPPQAGPWTPPQG